MTNRKRLVFGKIYYDCVSGETFIDVNDDKWSQIPISMLKDVIVDLYSEVEIIEEMADQHIDEFYKLHEAGRSA